LADLESKSSLIELKPGNFPAGLECFGKGELLAAMLLKVSQVIKKIIVALIQSLHFFQPNHSSEPK